jgi:hypothetical protein
MCRNMRRNVSGFNAWKKTSCEAFIAAMQLIFNYIWQKKCDSHVFAVFELNVKKNKPNSDNHPG